MYTISGAQINGLYAFYTANPVEDISIVTSGGVVSSGGSVTALSLPEKLTAIVNAGGGAVRVRNLSHTAGSAGYTFMANTADNNVDPVQGIPFKAGVVIRAVGLANLNPPVSGYDYEKHVVNVDYSSDTLFSYVELDSNHTVPANGAVTIICEVP